jgi:transcriptional regulator with XRE-family HTH domain
MAILKGRRRAIGRILSLRRAELRIDQSELSSRAGVPRKTVYNLERDKHKTTLLMLPFICQWYGLTPKQLNEKMKEDELEEV